jgi:hypothetical protein
MRTHFHLATQLRNADSVTALQFGAASPPARGVPTIGADRRISLDPEPPGDIMRGSYTNSGSGAICSGSTDSGGGYRVRGPVPSTTEVPYAAISRPRDSTRRAGPDARSRGSFAAGRLAWATSIPSMISPARSRMAAASPGCPQVTFAQVCMPLQPEKRVLLPSDFRSYGIDSPLRHR